MTALAVRDDIETQWPVLLPAIPLIAHANDASEKPTLPDEWAALLYGPGSEERASIGGLPVCWRESGTIEIRSHIKAGLGNRPALEMAEAIRTAWLDYTGVNGYLRFLSIGPPTDLNNAESNGDWYAVSVIVSYTYDTFR